MASKVIFILLVLLGAMSVFSSPRARDLQFPARCPKMLVCTDQAGLYFISPRGLPTSALLAMADNDHPPTKLVLTDTAGRKHVLWSTQPQPAKCERHCVSPFM